MKKKVAISLRKSVFFTLPILSLALAGCEQDPFPSEGRVFNTQPRVVKPAPVADIEMPATLECVENKLCSTQIRGVFAGGGTPVLNFKTLIYGQGYTETELPEGATFDAAQEVLSYTPGFDAVDNVKNPGLSVQPVLIEVSLRKEGDPRTIFKKKTLLVLVKNELRPVTIQPQGGPLSVIEGETLRRSVIVGSPDFPNGPFDLVVRGAPAGFSVEKTGDQEFEIVFSPGYGAVTYDDIWDVTQRRFKKSVDLEYVVYTPSGEAITQSATLVIYDRRLAPTVSAPAELRQGPVVNFTIRVDDLNGERPPAVNLPSSMPFGRLTVTEVPLSQPGFASRLFDVRWDEIPAAELGKTVAFTYLVCAASSATEQTQCRTHETQVTLMGASQ